MSLIPVSTLLLFISIGVNGSGVHSITDVRPFGVDGVISMCSSVEVFFQLVNTCCLVGSCLFRQRLGEGKH